MGSGKKVTKNLADSGRTLCCDRSPWYNDWYDVWFCPACLAWIEGKCDDPACGYCPLRPEKASPRDKHDNCKRRKQDETAADAEPTKRPATSALYPTTEQLAQEFSRLEKAWWKDASSMSNSDQMFAHPAYQRVIEMGPAAIPLLVNILKTEHGAHWMMALEAITGENPVPELLYGQVRNMCECWLRWAVERGYDVA